VTSPVEGLALARDGELLVVTLDRPTRRNALTPAMLRALAELRAELHDARCVILHGAGGAFSAGYDVTHLRPVAPGETAPDHEVERAAAALEALPCPVIAAIEGPAFGAGFMLAAACDLRVVASDARLSMPPARLGIVYPREGLVRLERLVGLSSAKRLVLTAEPIDAATAERLGLVAELTEPGGALDAARALAGKLCGLAPGALRGMKHLFGLAPDAPTPAAFEEERLASYGSEDAREGLRALAERRPPRFTGR